jgi:hypothetical protein
MWQPIPVQRSRETWGLPHTPYCFSALLKYTLQKINHTIAAWHNPEFMLLFMAWALKTRVRAPHCNWIAAPPGETRSHFCLFFVKEGLGFQNSRVKGIANWAKLQVPLHLTGRVSNKGPPQYQQTSTLETEQIYCSSLQRINLHCIQMSFPKTLALPHT